LLALLPFLLANMAGWMCSVRTRQSPWRFRLHRLAFGLGALALTVNASLVTVLIFADILAYQASRIGRGDRWWSAPLGWPYIAGHPARQVLVGMVVPVLLVLVLTWVTSRSFRYEAMRPPYRIDAVPKRTTSRWVTAAALERGLANDEFWDGYNSVRLLAKVHVAVALGFLAIVITVTVRALAVGTAHVTVAGWIAVGGGAATVALGIGYVCLDALTTPGAAEPGGRSRAGGTLADKLRTWIMHLPVLASAALIASGVFAWRQTTAFWTPTARAADLPGMTAVIGWTALVIAVPVAAALISTLLGLSRTRGIPHFGGPFIMLALAFSLLNTVMLGAAIVAAHVTGPVTNDSAFAVANYSHIYLPYVMTAGVPLAVWAAMLVDTSFIVIELNRMLRAQGLPDNMRRAYLEQAEAFSNRVPGPIKHWYEHGIVPPRHLNNHFPFNPVTDWESAVARVQLRGRMLLDAGRLLWMIIIAQLVIVWYTWQFHVQPPVAIAVVGVGIASLVLPIRMRKLLSPWWIPAQRIMTTLWDVAAFWPRSYHPFSPPCHAERAVPDLQRRMWMLHDIGRKLILVAHGQGAMLATAALVQPGCRPADDRPALVTLGSTVGGLYSCAFPAYLTPDLLVTLNPRGPCLISDWRNMYYTADPFAGPAASHLVSSDGRPVDHSLLDPAKSWWIYLQEDPPMPQGHSGYWKDPRVWEQVNNIAAAARHAPPVTSPHGTLDRGTGHGV
jgi:hypothetical protein